MVRKKSSSLSKKSHSSPRMVPTRRNSKGRVILQTLSAYKKSKTQMKTKKHSSPKVKKPSCRKQLSSCNKELTSCNTSKKRLQKSVLRLAAKLSLAKLKMVKSISKPKRKPKSKRKPKPKAKSKSKSKSRSTSSNLAKKEAYLRNKKAARVGKEDDWFSNLVNKYVNLDKNKVVYSDAQIQHVLEQAERDANGLQKEIARDAKKPTTGKINVLASNLIKKKPKQ